MAGAAGEEVVKPRVIFDCMIFLQAVVNESGPAAACLNKADGGPVELCLSPETRAEVHDVVNRRGVRKQFRALTDERVTNFLARLDLVATLISDVPAAFMLKRDPKDSKYINLAIAANAELVVSRDNDLLDLMTSDDAEPVAFRSAYPTIRILDPVAFLRTLPPAPSTDSSDEAH